MTDDKADPGGTYVLSETTLLEVRTIEELAKLAAAETESLDIESAMSKGTQTRSPVHAAGRATVAGPGKERKLPNQDGGA